MILDLYVLRRFTLWLALSVVLMWLVAVTVDIIENIDTFIDHDAGVMQIVRYYVYRSPYWIVLTLPAAALLGTLFSLTGLARRSEITAMKAAGIGLHRVLLPVLLFALCVSAAAMLFTEWIVPPATYSYNSTKNEIRSYSRSDGSRRQVLLQDVGGQLVFARSYDHQRQRAHQVLWENRPGGRTSERASAQRLDWRDDARWVLVAGTHYRVGGEHIEVSPFDTLTLASLTLLPVDFSRQRKKPEEMDFAELRAYIDRAHANGEDATRHLVDLHLKISFPLTCFVIVLVAAPVAANTRPRGRPTSLGIGVLICFSFYSCVKAGQALGWNEIVTPWQGAWLANIAFAAIGVAVLWRSHK